MQIYGNTSPSRVSRSLPNHRLFGVQASSTRLADRGVSGIAPAHVTSVGGRLDVVVPKIWDLVFREIALERRSRPRSVRRESVNEN